MFSLNYEFCHRHGYPLLIVHHKGNNPYQPTIQFGDMSNTVDYLGTCWKLWQDNFWDTWVAQPMEVQLEGCL